jgi:hypothetical protein
MYSGASYLIKCADWRYKDDSVRVVEIWNPGMPLATRASNVVQMPSHTFAVEVHIKGMFRDAHGLDAGMEDVVCKRIYESLKPVGSETAYRLRVYNRARLPDVCVGGS